MDPKRVTRKLRAILSADVQGYSRLMGDDEIATVKTITEYREIFASIVSQYNGRVVDSPGDNILSEFASVVDAVQCAVEIQKVLKAKNEDLPENRRMIFRIGVNLGDVIHEDDRIYGDGVNIAARIESLAEGGGICISGTAYDQIENKLALGYNYFGEHPVKNIAKPVRVYKVPMDPKDIGKKIIKPKLAKKAAFAVAVVLILGIAAVAVWNFYFRTPQVEPASEEKMAYSLPEKPSIAVLPFANMSGNPAQDYIADGISENIISALSKIGEIFVIARNSTFAYKNKSIKVQQVAEDLGVRYVLEGSVLESGNKIRITAQLIDAITGYHLWSEKYDRKIEDFFQLLDEITYEIVVALQVKLTHGEQVRKWFGTTNFAAWSDVAKGLGIFETYTKANNAKARELFENAVKIDPNCAFAWVMLGWTHFIDVRFAFTKTPAESLKKALQNAKKAQSIDDTLPDVPALLGSIYLIQRQYDKAIAEGQKSTELGPNSALSHVLFAQILYNSGNPEDAIAFVEQALRLCPNCPAWYSAALGKSYRTAGRYEDAIRVYKEVLLRARKGEFPPWLPNANLAITYAMMGQNEKASKYLVEAMKINPAYSLELEGKINFFRDPKQLEAIFDALRKAGMPDKTSPALPEKPSIAVLPFDNMSGDPKDDYLSDGITKQIITALSKTPKVFVIARNSVFTYKGKPVKVQQVSKELGVRYVLEGSVQKSGDRLRITAQLIDATTGNHVWGESFDRDLKDIFVLQDDITRNVIMALQVKLTEGETARLYGRGTDNLEAYLKVQKGIQHVFRWNRNDNEIGRQLYKEAIALDPGYANAYLTLGWTYRHEARFGWTKTPRKSREKAIELAEKALSIDPSNGIAYVLMATVYAEEGQLDKAIENGKKAISLEPSNSDVNNLYGYVLTLAGEHKKAIPVLEKAISLDPIPPFWYLTRLGWAYYYTGQNREARVVFLRAMDRSPGIPTSHACLGCALVAVGKPREALVEFDKALGLHRKPPTWFIGSRAIALVEIGKPEEAVTTMQDLISRQPDDADGYMLFSRVLRLEGEYEDALQMAKKAEGMRSGPYDSFELGMSYFMLKQYDQAIPQFKKSIQLLPDYLAPHLGLSAAYSLAGHMEEARAEAAEILRIIPKFSLGELAKNGYYNYASTDKERFFSALRKAGLK